MVFRILIFFIATLGSSLFFTTQLFAQSSLKKIETAEFEVRGVCQMCEKRIEEAALIKGVKFAEWSKETQMIKVMYKTKNTDLKAIKEAIAEVGHDTDSLKASEEAYAKLPGCCAYRDGVEVH